MHRWRCNQSSAQQQPAAAAAAVEPQHSSLGGCDVVVHKKRRQKRLSLGQCPFEKRGNIAEVVTASLFEETRPGPFSNHHHYDY